MRTITLKSTGVGRYDDVSPFLITDRELPLKIILPELCGEFVLVYENGGVTEKRQIPGSGELMLEVLAAGELRAEVKHYLKGGLIKVYKVEPLLLREVDGSLTAEPDITELRRTVQTLVKELGEERERTGALCNELTAERERFAERLAAAEEKIAGLLRFAKDDYENNVYLGSGEDFNEKYGFNLNEGEQENE